MLRLQNKVVLVTGAAQGIGRRCAEVFAHEGARVVVADQERGAGQAVAQSICDEGGEASFFQVDVAVPAEAEAMIRHATDNFRKLDVLVNSAAIGGRSLGDGPTHQCTPAAWDSVIRVNLSGTFLACKYALPELLKTRGNIITLSSVLGLVGSQGLFDTHAYATSKAGIIGLTRAIAAHYARDQIRANVLAPGLIDTAMAGRTKADPVLLEQVAFWQPLGPLGETRDVAHAAVFLASDEAKFITGAVLPVDGGWTAQ